MTELIEVDGLSADLDVVEDIVEVIELAEQGPPGPPGPVGPIGEGEISFSLAGVLSIAAGTLRRYISFARIITKIDANVGSAPTGGPVTILLKKNGVTINTITIAGGTNRQIQTGLALALAADDYLTVDRSAVNGAADLTIILRG